MALMRTKLLLVCRYKKRFCAFDLDVQCHCHMYLFISTSIAERLNQVRWRQCTHNTATKRESWTLITISKDEGELRNASIEEYLHQLT